MARSLFPILLLAIVGATTGFFEAAVPHQQEAAVIPKAAFAFGGASNSLVIDEGLDNPNVVSDMSIHPARKCGFCMGVSADMI
jgi:hypothetical protein